ncbi:MAG: 2-oxoacid:acceptor oxidoreductase family protein [Chloroflexia bacterium]|nr:2-oxoacid:acceptor oxidoreductase family protein [Chloroflexia bacterium]
MTEQSFPLPWRYEVRLSGLGGQGLMLAGRLLAEAAVHYDGKYATQTQSYGPESRGGDSRSDVVISDQPIDYPHVIKADLIVAMSQMAMDRNFYTLKHNGILIVDEDMVEHIPTTMAYIAPITRLAQETVGRAVVANVVALGVVVSLCEVVSRQAITNAVLNGVPAGTEILNRRALEEGFRLGEQLRR